MNLTQKLKLEMLTASARTQHDLDCVNDLKHDIKILGPNHEFFDKWIWDVSLGIQRRGKRIEQ